jgi:uncharacterized protein (DUF885 family)
MRNWLRLLFLLFPLTVLAQNTAGLQQLGADFWNWRFVTQPASPDDILRVERPDGWAPDFSPEAITGYQSKYREFRHRLDSLPHTGWTVPDSVDYLCLRAAIERVHWELDVLRAPFRNPDFYVHQTIGALYELLIIHQPFSAQRIGNILQVVQSIPKTVADAKANLSQPVAAFAQIALDNLDGVEEKLLVVRESLNAQATAPDSSAIATAFSDAITALLDYREWISRRLPQMNNDFSCGADAYRYFLKNIALIPLSPDELLQQGRMAFDRAVAFETLESVRNAGLPEDAIFPTLAAQIEKSTADELAIRAFLEEKNIMTVPGWLQHYVNVKVPPYVKALGHMGVATDFTSEHRLDQNAVRYARDPRPDLPYFYRSMAQDPRPIILHEGIPGHYFQLALSWRNDNPIRRRFVDSGPIEGIGLYVEELLLQFGLFDNKPKSREIIYNFMRLRALRVEIDIRLATGSFSIPQAGDYLAKTIPMDRETAAGEAGFFAYNPGQAISYQIGKLQILNFLSDAKIKLGDRFNLRDFHDYLIVNGNVPIALLRWEYLGLRDEIQPFFTAD